MRQMVIDYNAMQEHAAMQLNQLLWAKNFNEYLYRETFLEE